jgi:hypothetical protein
MTRLQTFTYDAYGRTTGNVWFSNATGQDVPGRFVIAFVAKLML